MNFTIIASAIAGIIGFGLAWQSRTSTITEMELEHANTRIELQRQSRRATEAAMARVSEAQSKAQTRVVTVVANRNRADTATVGLRTAATATLRATNSDPSACPNHAATLDVVFGECASKLVEVAENADRWTNETMTLRDAWHK